MPTMNPTPFFEGEVRSVARKAEAAKVQDRLVEKHPELRGFLWSAAAYLLRDGQPLRDSTVLEEARRRRASLNAALKRRQLRFGARKERA